MIIERFDHFSIVTNHLEETKQFYADILGFEAGDRPNFSFPGYWLYNGSTCVVHLIGRATQEKRLSPGPGFDHIAFRGKGPSDLLSRLALHHIPYRTTTIPGREIDQVFFHDPNGIKIEILF